MKYYIHVLCICLFFEIHLILITPMVSSNFSDRKNYFYLKLKIHIYTSVRLSQSNINLSVLFVGYIPFVIHDLSRVCNQSNKTDATNAAGTATSPEYTSSPPIFSWVRVARSLVLCVVFCRSLSFFFWSSSCLSFDLRLLITAFVSSNFC